MIKPKREIQIARWTIPIPGTPLARKALGAALVVGGILGFLPILGFWMIPLGLVVLSIDLPSLRKYRRKWDVKLERRRRSNAADAPESTNQPPKDPSSP